MSAASAGDTIQMYQQYWPSSPGTISVNKPLKFIGFGHTLDKNKNLQAVSTADNYSVSLSFVSGSGGSIVTGLYCGTVQISTSNIAISRSKIESYIQLLTSTSALSNITLSNNFFTCAGCNVLYISGTNSTTNLYVNNNIIFGYTTLSNCSGMFVNNYVGPYSTTLYSFIVRNNIL
jgi:hypothetical protein